MSIFKAAFSCIALLTIPVCADAETKPIAACTLKQLKIAVAYSEDASGMSHSGDDLTIRNVSKTRCSLTALPEITFLDAHNRALNVARNVPSGFIPGPVILPVILEPKEKNEARTTLRWVSGDVFGNGYCVSPVKIRVQSFSFVWNGKIDATLCGEKRRTIKFEQPVLTTR